MKAVAALLVSLAFVIAPAVQAQPPTATRLAQGQLPSIDRPVPAPSHVTASSTRYRGHFFFETEVNGVPVPMMFDTGSTYVALRAEDAARAGINISSLNYTVRSMTANGVALSAPVVLRVMKVGNITRTNVLATVGRPGAQKDNLLGQSFMSTMAGFSTEGDKLILRGE